MKSVLQFPSLSRALGVAAVTTLVAALALYATFLETDYGKALFFTYDEIWEVADQQESSGNLRQAERLIRHIVATEENRVTLGFGLFVLFAGPDYLVHAKLKLASLHWRMGRLDQADAGYRDALVTISDTHGRRSWRNSLGHLRYAQFLAATGRIQEAGAHLREAETLNASLLREAPVIGGAPWREAEHAERKSILDDLSRDSAALRDKHEL